MLPLWGDVKDARARVGPRGSLADALKIAVPSAVASLSGAASLMKFLLQGYPGLNNILDGIASIAGFVAVVFVVVATIPDPEALIAGRLRYRFPQFERTCAKILLLPLFALAVVGTWRSLPVGITSSDFIDGYLCTPSGTPIANAAIVVLDATGTPAALPSFPTDSDGYFVAKLDWWAATPRTFTIAVPQCKPVTIQVSSSIPSAEAGCRGGNLNNRSKEKRDVWYVELKRSALV